MSKDNKLKVSKEMVKIERYIVTTINDTKKVKKADWLTPYIVSLNGSYDELAAKVVSASFEFTLDASKADRTHFQVFWLTAPKRSIGKLTEADRSLQLSKDWETVFVSNSGQ